MAAGGQQSASSEMLGKTVFVLTFIGVLVFFWWLLIYDHGVAPVVH